MHGKITRSSNLNHYSLIHIRADASIGKPLNDVHGSLISWQHLRAWLHVHHAHRHAFYQGPCFCTSIQQLPGLKHVDKRQENQFEILIVVLVKYRYQCNNNNNSNNNKERKCEHRIDQVLQIIQIYQETTYRLNAYARHLKFYSGIMSLCLHDTQVQQVH